MTRGQVIVRILLVPLFALMGLLVSLWLESVGLGANQPVVFQAAFAAIGAVFGLAVTLGHFRD